MGWAVGIDSEAELMDGDVMVIPAQSCEVFGVVVVTCVLFLDVMRL